MSERSATERLEALWRWIYRGTTTVVAATLTVAGIVCIVGATLIPEDEVWHPILRDVGVAALASGLLSTAYEYFLRRAFLEDATNGLRKIFGERDEKLDQLEKAGFKGIHPKLTKLGKSHIAMEFRRARHSIRILQTWLGNFSEDNDIGDALREVTRGADIGVRILLLNPRSSVAPLRGKDLNEDVEERIKEDIKQLKRLCNDRPCAAERIQVRFYDATPAMSIYGYDDRNVVGFF